MDLALTKLATPRNVFNSKPRNQPNDPRRNDGANFISTSPIRCNSSKEEEDAPASSSSLSKVHRHIERGKPRGRCGMY